MSTKNKKTINYNYDYIFKDEEESGIIDDGLTDEERFKYKAQEYRETKNLKFILKMFLDEEKAERLSKELISRYLNIHRVCSVPQKELMKFDGITERISHFLITIPFVFKTMQIIQVNDKSIFLDTKEKVISYIGPAIHNLKHEEFFILCLNGAFQLIDSKLVRGDIGQVGIDVTEIAKFIYSTNAVNVVLVHNHPSGNYMPSICDIVNTKKIINMLRGVKINLTEHLIAGKSGYFSFEKSRLIDAMDAVLSRGQNPFIRIMNQADNRAYMESKIESLNEPYYTNEDKRVIAACLLALRLNGYDV